MLVRWDHVQNNLEKRLCLTAADLSQLLDHVLKLDRLRRLLDMASDIRNYLQLHPITTFNALKALKLECTATKEQSFAHSRISMP